MAKPKVQFYLREDILSQLQFIADCSDRTLTDVVKEGIYKIIREYSETGTIVEIKGE